MTSQWQNDYLEFCLSDTTLVLIRRQLLQVPADKGLGGRTAIVSEGGGQQLHTERCGTSFVAQFLNELAASYLPDLLIYPKRVTIYICTISPFFSGFGPVAVHEEFYKSRLQWLASTQTKHDRDDILQNSSICG